MVDEGAPSFAIEDYMYEMLHGDWVECTCEASKGE